MLRYIDRLILFETIRNDGIAERIAGLISSGDSASPEQSETKAREAYYPTVRALLKNIGDGGISGNVLQDHFCGVIASEENAFARLAEKGIFERLNPGATDAELRSALSETNLAVLLLAASEIERIAPVYNFTFSTISGGEDSPDIAALPATETGEGKSGLELIHIAIMQKNSTDAAIMLARYYRGYGSGVFGKSPALSAEKDGLVPVLHADRTTMGDIIGCDRQKRILMDNIEILLAGFRSNNVLLYGDSGTGKSSTVKALLNMYAPRGLKLISITKENFGLLPGVFAQIANRGMKFIIFIDDLSFDENEHEYKVFKSIVEGRIAPRPTNAIFIVTTNRKNIVKDVWSDREGGDDVRIRDNMEEKRSLSDRFGVTLTYPAPTKQEYLEIVRGIAAGAGLSMPDGQLAAEALKWEIRHGGRSGRTARQFVDYMVGIRAIDSGGIEE